MHLQLLPSFIISFNTGFAIILQEYNRCVVYLNENPLTIMNGAYSTMFNTNIPGVHYVLGAA